VLVTDTSVSLKADCLNRMFLVVYGRSLGKSWDSITNTVMVTSIDTDSLSFDIVVVRSIEGVGG
jgi:hypothetical protein